MDDKDLKEFHNIGMPIPKSENTTISMVNRSRTTKQGPGSMR